MLFVIAVVAFLLVLKSRGRIGPFEWAGSPWRGPRPAGQPWGGQPWGGQPWGGQPWGPRGYVPRDETLGDPGAEQEGTSAARGPRPFHQGPPWDRPSPESVLAGRLAYGEISPEEYLERLSLLKDA